MTTAEYPVWQLPFKARNGHTYRWWHMPGSDVENRKLNFALFRRGLVQLTDIQEEAAEEDHSNDEPIACPGAGAGKSAPRLANNVQRCRTFKRREKVEKTPKEPQPPQVLTTSERFPNGLPPQMQKRCKPGELETLYGRLLELAKERGIRHHELVARFGINQNKINPSGLKLSGDKLKQKLEHAISKLSPPVCEKIA